MTKREKELFEHLRAVLRRLPPKGRTTLLRRFIWAATLAEKDYRKEHGQAKRRKNTGTMGELWGLLCGVRFDAEEIDESKIRWRDGHR